MQRRTDRRRVDKELRELGAPQEHGVVVGPPSMLSRGAGIEVQSTSRVEPQSGGGGGRRSAAEVARGAGRVPLVPTRRGELWPMNRGPVSGARSPCGRGWW